MLSILKYGYKVTKPRVKTQNIQNLLAYRKQLHQARVRVHQQATQYMNKIEDQFLDRHKKRMARRHFNNQCNFREKIARNSYLIYQRLQKDKQQHKQYLRRMEKFVRQQQIKKLNRDRIKKILEYQSANFWLSGQNISEKVISQRVLPQYIGSTEYYHKLHSQALAYDQLDFDLLHKLSSNQESVKYKNQLLIPLYKQVLVLMRQVKFSEQQRLNKQFQQHKIKLQQKYRNDKQRYNQQLDLRKNEFDKKMRQFQTRRNDKKQYFKSKVKQLILLLKKWKQYTDVLGMTSAQALKAIGQSKNQQQIRARSKILQKQIAKNRQTTFVDAVEQDTQDQQITLSNFLEKNQQKDQTIKTSKKQNDDLFSQQLQNLIKQQQSLFNQISLQIKQESKQKQVQHDVNTTKNIQQIITLSQELKVDQGYLKPSQTTSSIQVLKQQYTGDEVLQSLFNLAGQLTIQYPKLFKKVWSMQIL